MKNFLTGLIVVLLFIVAFAIGFGCVWLIAGSDLPFWVKLWLLK